MKTSSLIPLCMVVVLAVAGLSGAFASPAKQIGEKPPIGKPAPDFSLPDLDGKTVKLSQFRRKLVVLEWFSDECPFVKKHYKSGNMQALQEESVKKGVIWLTICSSAEGKHGYHSNDEHKKVLKSWNANMTDFLVDADGKVGRLYGSKNTPTMYIVGKDGKLIYEGAIDNKPDPFPDTVSDAHNYVRAALDEAMAGNEITESVTRAYG